MTAVSVACSRVDWDHKVLALVSDCGLPGNNNCLLQHTPCSIFHCSFDNYWIFDLDHKVSAVVADVTLHGLMVDVIMLVFKVKFPLASRSA